MEKENGEKIYKCSVNGDKKIYKMHKIDFALSIGGK